MSIDTFIRVAEVDDPTVADAMFRRAYGKPVPEFPHHIVAFLRRADGAEVPASYVHFTDCGDMFLAGGACTDGSVLRAMTPDQQAALQEYGGLMLATLRLGFALFGSRCQAVFTCCGDRRALETTPKVGFVETGIQYLLVSFVGASSAQRRREMTAKAASFMPF